MIHKNNIDDKIVLFGMSCSGKTSFAKQLTTHKYHCFDAMFNWKEVETLGLCAHANLKIISEKCTEEKYVLDGWHLSDKGGLLLPKDAKVYVICSTYHKIISQYRIKVNEHNEYRPMFNQWYKSIDYEKLNATYFLNAGNFKEITKYQFDFLCNV